MSTSGVGKLSCLTNDIIKWEIPSFHLLPKAESIHIWSPVFIYYHKYTSYAIPRNKYFNELPSKKLGLKITSNDVQYNQLKHVQIGVTDELNTIVINRCDGEWTEQTGGNNYIKVKNILNDECLILVLNIYSTNELRLRFFCIAPNERDYAIASIPSRASTSKLEGSWKCRRCTLVNSNNISNCGACNLPKTTDIPGAFLNKYPATASIPSCSSASKLEDCWNCRYCTLVNSNNILNCEACNLPKTTDIPRVFKNKYPESSQKVNSAAGNPATPITSLLLCIICITKERNIVFQPCGHLITCTDCADFRMKYCPICRKDIVHKLKTYIN